MAKRKRTKKQSNSGSKKGSKVGSILLLISAILTYIVAVIVFIASIAVGIYFRNTLPEAPLVFVFGTLIAILIWILGYLKLVCSRMMKDYKKTLSGGIFALILGIISGFDVLAVIGGIFGIVEGAK